MRAYLIDAEQRAITEIDFAGGLEEIQRRLNCSSFTSGARPLNGSMSKGFDTVYVSDDPLEDHDDPKFWFQIDEDVRAFLRRLNPAAEVMSGRVAILPEHVARFRLQTAPRKATDNRSFEGIGDDPDATVQAEALDPADLAALVEAALMREWDIDAAQRTLEREHDERERLRGWLARGRSAP